MAKTFRKALETLLQTAAKLGFETTAVTHDAELVSAAVSEANIGAYVDWCHAFGKEVSATPFMEAAVAGRKYRASRTPLATQATAANKSSYLKALSQVAFAAASLGTPNERSAQAAKTVAAIQLTGAAEITPQIDISNADLAATTAVFFDNTAAWGDTADSTATQDAASQREFAANAPAIWGDVMDRLATVKQNLTNMGAATPNELMPLGSLDVTGLGPGAIPGLPGTLFTPTSGAIPQMSSDLDPETATPNISQPDASNPGAPDDPTATDATDTAAQGEFATGVSAKKLPQKPVEEWLAELDELVGLDTVKTEIRRQTAILRVDALRSKAGLKSPTITRHLIFTGNPGTGKTTVARMVSGIYQAIGLLSKGTLVEVDRSELVAGYLGQTAMKTAEVVQKAIGGVLFIDEAYSLNGDQYGEEAINTLVKEMEDNRDDLVVIVAGYPAPMATFISQNPGLASRFRTEINFANYTDDDLVGIFASMAQAADYDLGEGVAAEFTRLLALQLRDETFGNARYARNVMEAAIGKHAWRLHENEQPTLEELRTLLPEDLSLDAPESAVSESPTASSGIIESQILVSGKSETSVASNLLALASEEESGWFGE